MGVSQFKIPKIVADNATNVLSTPLWEFHIIYIIVPKTVERGKAFYSLMGVSSCWYPSLSAQPCGSSSFYSLMGVSYYSHLLCEYKDGNFTPIFLLPYGSFL